MGVENCYQTRMLITDQVATAPCTDCVQARGLTFEAKLLAYGVPTRYREVVLTLSKSGTLIHRSKP